MAGRSPSGDPIFRRLEQLPVVIHAAQRQVADDAGRLIAQTTEKRIREASGGDGVLSGMMRATGTRSTRKPKPMGTFHRVEPRPGGFQAYVRATGPVHLVEHDVARHIVVSRWAKGAGYTRTTKAGKTVQGRSTRESRVASVAFGLGAAGGGRRAVLHWGSVFARYSYASSKGRQPWKRGVDEARPRLGEIQAAAQRAAIRSALR